MRTIVAGLSAFGLLLAAHPVACPHAEAISLRSKDQRMPGAGAEPVRGCAGYEPGFVPVPGTDTCVRIGGSIRIEAGTTFGGSAPRR